MKETQTQQRTESLEGPKAERESATQTRRNIETASKATACTIQEAHNCRAVQRPNSPHTKPHSGSITPTHVGVIFNHLAE